MMISDCAAMCSGKFLPLVLFLSSLLFALPVPARADERVVTVGVYENAPKVFTDGSGKPAGIFIDIIEQVAKAEGWRLRYVHGTWAEGLDRTARGEIDLMPDVAYTTEREKVYSFHKVQVLSGWSQVYARKGSGIESILDLNGKRVAALEQTIQLETFQRLAHGFELKIHLVPVPDYQTEFEMIAAGKVDAGVTNRFYGLMNARKFGLEDTPVMFDPAPFFFAAAKGASAPLLEAIDRHLAEMKKNPRSPYYASLRRWTTDDVQFRLPAWLKVLGLVTGVVLVMSLAGSFILKQQVNTRTRELEQANEVLRESEQRYRQLFERNPAPMLIYERGTWQLLAVNDAFVSHYGYSREQAHSLVLSDLYPDEEKERIKEVASGLKGHAYVGEWHHLLANGSLITVVARSHDTDYFGREARIAVITDVTEMKRMEAELRNVNETLDMKVRERTVELVEKNEELAAVNEKLQELDRLKSMFIASMSHELRTPLNSILGFTGILLQGMAGPLNVEQQKQLTMVKGSAKHLLELITDIIDLSKIEAGKIEIVPAEFNLMKVVLEVAGLSGPAADRKNLTISVEGPQTLTIRSDERRIRQVLMNLVGNAVKFTDEGGVRLVVAAEEELVTVRVRDTGPGIRPEDMSRLFRFFSRIPSPDLRVYEGTGLGLYLSRKLMQLLGGDVTAESEVGKGSTFTMSLPFTEKSQ